MEKPKRILSQEQLEKLKIAREKALKVRQAKKEKDLKTLEKQAKAKDIENKLLSYQETTVAPPPAPEPEPESEPEETPPPSPVKKVKKKTRKPIVIVEESDSSESEDEQVVYIKRSKGKRPKPQVAVEPEQYQYETWSANNCYGGGRNYRR